MTHTGKSSAPKGERGMNKYSVFKFVLASVACCMIIAAFLTGCGGSNNPAGSSGGTTLPSVVPVTASGTVTLSGKLIDASTNALVNDSNANITVTVSLIGTSFTTNRAAEQNSAFAFFGLPAGNYFIKASDSSGRFETNQIIKELTGDTVDLALQMVPVRTALSTVSLNFFGKVLESTLKKPVMFSTILVTNSSGISFETSTLFDGSFSLQGLASGTYEISFRKTGFETASRTLTISDDRIRIGTKEITATDIGNFADGANVIRSGYNVGEIVLAPIWLETGAIAGILLNSDLNPKVPYANTRFDLVYDDNPKDGVPPASIIKNFTTNDLGYFFAKNLPRGWYLVVTNGYTTTPIISGTQIVGYNIIPPAGGTVVFNVWLEVRPGSVTPIPQED